MPFTAQIVNITPDENGNFNVVLHMLDETGAQVEERPICMAGYFSPEDIAATVNSFVQSYTPPAPAPVSVPLPTEYRPLLGARVQVDGPIVYDPDFTPPQPEPQPQPVEITVEPAPEPLPVREPPVSEPPVLDTGTATIAQEPA